MLWESRRRLPEMPRMRIGSGLLDELQVDRDQRDVVGQRLGAVGLRHLPVEAELAAVDRGLELEGRCASLPKASPPTAKEPVAVTGFVTPRIVRSPSSSAVPSSASRMSVERKVMVGVFSTSKKSAASRWSLNRGSSMTIERASAEPVEHAVGELRVDLVEACCGRSRGRCT